MVFKLVILDWSGVISDDGRVVHAAMSKLAKDHGAKPFDYDDWLKATTMYIPTFLESLGIDLDYDTWIRTYEEYYHKEFLSGNIPSLIDGVRDVIEYLHENNYRLAVISSHPKDALQREAKSFCLDKYFSEMISSREKVVSIRLLMSHLCLTSDDVLFIGDMADDIRAGKIAGIKTAGVCTGYHCREILEKEEPDYIFSTLDGLRIIL